MKIIVCLKEAVDPTLALDFGLDNRVLFREGLPLRLDPASAMALQKALEIGAASGADVTAVSIGPERVEKYLRDALELGASRAVRIDDEASTPYRKAVLLAGAAGLWGADIILAGARSPDTASGQVAALVAARLGLPCVTDAVALELEADGRGMVLARDIGRGERERVRCPLPAVVGFKGEGRLPYAPLDRFVESRQAGVERVAPVDMGVSPLELGNGPVRVGGLVFPRPRPRKAPPLDSSLPAFERILQLLRGGLSRRRGRVLTGGAGELAAELFELLKEAGAIKTAGGR